MIDRPIKAVLFDMYGTLLFEEGGLEYRYREVARRAGLDERRFIEARNRSMHATLTGEIPNGVERAKVILKDMGLSPAEEKARLLAQAEENVRVPAVHLYPATLPTLRALRRRGYRLGLISDCTYLWRPVLRLMRLEDKFDAITLSCEVGMTKPEPAMYLRTCEALGVRPAVCVFVGDGGSDELQGARALGIVAILVDQEWGVSRSGEKSDFDYVIHNLCELLDLLPPRAADTRPISA